MLMEQNRHIRIDGAYNIRDLGGYSNQSGGTTRWRSMLRADSLHRLAEAGVEALLAEGVTTVVDLRRADELDMAPNPFRDHPGVRYLNVSLFADLAPDSLERCPIDGQWDVLGDLYVRAVTIRQNEFRKVLEIIADAPEGAVVFHCTAGKDRTGLIAAFLLSIAEIDLENVLDDYVLTGACIEPIVDELIASATARGVDAAAFIPLLACERDTLRATFDHLVERYGSVLGYLRAIGVDAATIARLKARLLGEADVSGA